MSAGVTAAIVGLMATAGQAGVPAGNGPNTPAWVTSDGKVDPSKMPERIKVIGSDGKPLKDATGRQVTVSRDELLARRSAPGPAAQVPAGKNPNSEFLSDENGNVRETRKITDKDARSYGP
jgi:hypothetical protein